MSLDALVPVGGDHAIQNIAFVLNWSVEMTDGDLRAVRDTHSKLKHLLPVEQEMQMLQMTMRAPLPNQSRTGKKQRNDSRSDRSGTRQVLGGIQFVKPAAANRFGQAAVSRSIQINQQNLVVSLHEYKGWDDAFEFVRECLTAVLPAVVKGRPILGCTLQYHDSFSWKDQPEKLSMATVFRKGGQYLPPSVFERGSLWHSHHGYMEERTSPVAHQLIENVNVDLVQTDPWRVINIVLAHVGKFGSSGWSFETAFSQSMALFQDFHNRDKSIIGQLLEDSVCRKIGLIKGGSDADAGA